MRFTDRDKQEQLKALVRLHDRLNDGLFNGELERAFCLPPFDERVDGWTPPEGKRMQISIGGIGTEFFKYKACCVSYKGIGDITFNYNYIRYLLTSYTEVEQFNDLAVTMLHEMIHQYIAENGIKDNSPHGNKFKQECKRHGLYRHTVLNGDDEKEVVDELMPQAEDVLTGFNL